MQSPPAAEKLIEATQGSCLGPLDSALHQLGMLATTTCARRQYLREKNRALSRGPLLQIGIRNMTMCVRPMAPYARYKPYTTRERHRTKSENNEEKDASIVGAVVDEVIDDSVDLAQLKKAKSLESIVAESNADLENTNITELEVVSNCIQNLRVAE